MFCKHHYQYTQGHFVCAKCGKTQWQQKTHWKKSRKRPIVIVGIITIVVIGFLIFYSNIHTTYVTIPLPKLPTSISTPLHSIEPQIIKTISNLSNSIPRSPSIQLPTIQAPSITAPVITKPEISITDLEQKIHDGINLQRQNQGLSPLIYDSKIADVARAHSLDMATRNYFEHDTPEGVTPAQRGTDAGYTTCGDRQAIADSNEYNTLSKEFQATGNTDQNMYNQLQVLYTKVNSEISNGMLFEGFAENIEQNNLYDSVEYIDGVPYYHWLTEDQLADSVVQTWMGSEGHRHNILTPAFYSEGIGVAIASDDKVYITEDFC
jgi:uncharacterized protein YkwD